MTVVVFGGTGFLGRRVVRHLLDRARPVRIASRHPDRGRELFGATVESVCADVHDAGTINEALKGATAAVNAISLYVERGNDTFQSVHIEAARRLARCARESNVEKLVHLSGIGSDPASNSSYIRSRGQGEQVVRAEFPAATMVRPAVMFGPDDAFLTVLIKLLKWLPAYPLFGRGGTRLQPAYVEDVAEAIVRSIESDRPERVLELGGPDILTYRELLETIAQQAGIKRLLVPARRQGTPASLPPATLRMGRAVVTRINTSQRPQKEFLRTLEGNEENTTATPQRLNFLGTWGSED